MQENMIKKIKADPAYQELITKRGSFAIKLSVTMLVVYFAFILTIAFNPAALGTPLSDNSVTTIGKMSFRKCRNLTSVRIPDSVTVIGPMAFFQCSSLTRVEIPIGVSVIGGAVFFMCRELISVRIPNSITAIGSMTFWGCSRLTSIKIPKSVTTIGKDAFFGCKSLSSIYLPKKSITRFKKLLPKRLHSKIVGY